MVYGRTYMYRYLAHQVLLPPTTHVAFPSLRVPVEPRDNLSALSVVTWSRFSISTLRFCRRRYKTHRMPAYDKSLLWVWPAGFRRNAVRVGFGWASQRRLDRSLAIPASLTQLRFPSFYTIILHSLATQHSRWKGKTEHTHSHPPFSLRIQIVL